MTTLPLFRCRECGRALKPGTPYSARGIGPVCGGRIHRPRPSARPVVTARAQVLEQDSLLDEIEEGP